MLKPIYYRGKHPWGVADEINFVENLGKGIWSYRSDAIKNNARANREFYLKNYISASLLREQNEFVVAGRRKAQELLNNLWGLI